LALIERLDRPLVVSSVRDEDEVVEYTTDPELIAERFATQVDAVIDSGYGSVDASTVIDCTEGSAVVVREGLGAVGGLL